MPPDAGRQPGPEQDDDRLGPAPVPLDRVQGRPAAFRAQKNPRLLLDMVPAARSPLPISSAPHRTELRPIMAPESRVGWIATVNAFLYVGRPGYYYSPDAASYYLRARHDDPATARFLSQDPVGFEPDNANLYTYLRNLPTERTDPTGLSGEQRPIK
jgi:RHS repeat-associated protein